MQHDNYKARAQVNATGASRLRELGIYRPGIPLADVDRSERGEWMFAHDENGHCFILHVTGSGEVRRMTNSHCNTRLVTLDKIMGYSPAPASMGVLLTGLPRAAVELAVKYDTLGKRVSVLVGAVAETYDWPTPVGLRELSAWGIPVVAGVWTDRPLPGSLAYDADGDLWLWWPEGKGKCLTVDSGSLIQNVDCCHSQIEVLVGLDAAQCDELATRVRSGNKPLNLEFSDPPVSSKPPALSRCVLEALRAAGVEHDPKSWREIRHGESVLAYDAAGDFLLVEPGHMSWIHVDGVSRKAASQSRYITSPKFVVANLDSDRVERMRPSQPIAARVAIATAPVPHASVPTSALGPADPTDLSALRISGPPVVVNSPHVDLASGAYVLRRGGASDLLLVSPAGNKALLGDDQAASSFDVPATTWPTVAFSGQAWLVGDFPKHAMLLRCLLSELSTADRVAVIRAARTNGPEVAVASLKFSLEVRRLAPSGQAPSVQTCVDWCADVAVAERHPWLPATDLDRRCCAWGLLQVRCDRVLGPDDRAGMLSRFASHAVNLSSSGLVWSPHVRRWFGDATPPDPGAQEETQTGAWSVRAWERDPLLLTLKDAMVLPSVAVSFITSPAPSTSSCDQADLSLWRDEQSVAVLASSSRPRHAGARSWHTDRGITVAGVLWTSERSTEELAALCRNWRMRAATTLRSARVVAWIPPWMPEIGELLPSARFVVGDTVRYVARVGANTEHPNAPPLGWSGDVTRDDHSTLPFRVEGARWSPGRDAWWFAAEALELVRGVS